MINDLNSESEYAMFFQKLQSDSSASAVHAMLDDLLPRLQGDHFARSVSDLVRCSSALSDARTAQTFLKECLSAVSGSIDACVEAVAGALESERRIEFVPVVYEFACSAHRALERPDINAFLALQSPVFAYATSGDAQSREVFRLWFGRIAATLGADAFGEDYSCAVAYFKLMNHAFFQSAITSTQSAVQDPFLVEAQRLMKEAVVLLSYKLRSK